jgi:NADH:ubiquinone oxidoreductase subunit K
VFALAGATALGAATLLSAPAWAPGVDDSATDAVVVLLGLLFLVAARGLWLLRNWARVLLLALLVPVAVVSFVVALGEAAWSLGPSAFAFAVFALAYGGVRYLKRESTKRLFQSSIAPNR